MRSCTAKRFPMKRPRTPIKKNYRQILKEEVDAGANELRRSTAGLFLSGLSAGLDIGFSLLALGVVMSLISPDAGPLFRRAVLANAYSVGFIFVKLGSSELFTEHTTLAVFPVLRGRSTLKNLARLWGIVYVGNIAGAIVLAALVVLLSHQSELIHPQVFGVLARGAVDHPWWLLFLSAVLAGWMMGLLSWLTSATTETSGQIVCIWLVAAMIGLSGLDPHHRRLRGSVVRPFFRSLHRPRRSRLFSPLGDPRQRARRRGVCVDKVCPRRPGARPLMVSQPVFAVWTQPGRLAKPLQLKWPTCFVFTDAFLSPGCYSRHPSATAVRRSRSRTSKPSPRSLRRR